MQSIELNTKVSSKFDFNANIDQEVTFTGSVQNIRLLSWGAFLILRLPNYLIQVVINKDIVKLQPEIIPVESIVKVRGKLKQASLKDKALNPSDVEIEAIDVQPINTPCLSPLPLDISKKELHANFNTILDLRPLSLRHPREKAIFRIQAGIFNEFGNYLTNIGFTRICSPKLVFSGTEGGANVFSLDYFGNTAYLAQSPQFYKQIMVGVFGRVFEEAPVFRAEKHNTSRHINEYISLDFEMQIEADFLEIIQVEVNCIKSILSYLQKYYISELELLEVKLPVINEIILLEFQEVHEIVYKEFNIDYRSEYDLAPEEEKLVCQYGKEKWNTDFIFVTHYPGIKRPFYAMDDPERPELTLSFDLLFRGMEITTGGQRLNRYEDYISKMTAREMDFKAFEPYLQTFKYGMPLHGGLGFGLERFTAKLCDIENIKACSLFPRDIDRLIP